MLLSSLNGGQMTSERNFRVEISVYFAITSLFGGEFVMKQILSSILFGLLLTCFIPQVFAASQINSDWSRPLQFCWEFPTDEMSVFPVFTDNKQTAFLALADGSIVALDADAGKFVWRTEFGGKFIAAPIYSEGKIFLLQLAGDDSGEDFILRTVSAVSGLTVAQKNLGRERIERAFLQADENFLYVFADDGSLKAFEKDSGVKIFDRKFVEKITSAPFLSENKIFIGSEGKKILMVSAADGSLLETFATENPIVGNLQFADETLYFGDALGNVSALRVSERKILWKFRTGAGIVDLATVNENLLATSNDGFVYMLSQKSGKRIWKLRLSGRLIGRSLLNHRFLITQTLDGTQIPVLDASSGKIVNQINLSAEAFTINGAAGDDKILLIPTNRGLQAFANVCRK
jgi:outer membrane protein assembly factor BamB